MIFSVTKRAFDILFALIFITLLSPVYILTALIIMIVSPGSPIYKARRVGRGGKVFTCYKFRSMHKDSGAVRLTTLKSDERIFRFGRFIRSTKIDEFPQAFNILFGQMSVVGPRPEDEAIYREQPEAYSPLTAVKPGLTSPASVYDYTHGERMETVEEYEEKFLPQKLSLEVYYIKNRSFFYDLRIVARTFFTILGILFGKKNFKEPKELSAALAVYPVSLCEKETVTQ